MNKVTTINLNGTAYQVEEDGYAALSAYLAQAAAKLEGNPDKDEIMSDFEQAVAEKFQAYISASKNVITTEEVQKTIDAMGPVEGEGTASDSAEEKTGASNTTPHPRKLYRIHEGSFLMGVCTGLAVYFGVDVTLVRILFILLAIGTSGGAFLAYFLIAILTPQASTISEAEAGNIRPFNASEFIQRAQKDYEYVQAYRNKREWKQWKRSMKYGVPPAGTNYPTGGYYMFPFINLLRLILLLAFLGALVSLVAHHAVLGIVLPFGFPLWIAIVLLFAVWQFVSFPIRWIKWKTYASYMPASVPPHTGQDIFWHTIASIVWVAFIALCIWLCYLYVQPVHTVLNEVSAKIQTAATLNRIR